MDNLLNNYRHLKKWFRRGKDFGIEIVCWEKYSKKDYDKLANELLPFYNLAIPGLYVWNIYCYIYPKNEYFNKLTQDTYLCGNILPFHGGCTFAEWHKDKEMNVITKQYGCDYNHWDDYKFQRTSNPKEVPEVFQDAEELFQLLNRENKEVKFIRFTVKKGE